MTPIITNAALILLMVESICLNNNGHPCDIIIPNNFRNIKAVQSKCQVSISNYYGINIRLDFNIPVFTG